MIKDYMVSQLEDTFPKTVDQLKFSQNEQKEDQSNQNPVSRFKQNRPQKIELFHQEIQSNLAGGESPETILVRKQSSGTGFMRPQNSPVRLRAKKKRTLMHGSSRNSLNRKNYKKSQEHEGAKA